MRYCTRCLSPSTRPNAKFDAHGVCIPCTYAEASQDVAYEERFRELKDIVNRLTRRRKYQEYDCIVGVSGGKDSTRQALWVREKLGLNPLLVCVAYPPKQVSQVGVDNLSNLISHGFDCIMLGPAPETRAGHIEATVVLEVVNPDLESVPHQPCPKLRRYPIRAFWNEIEGGSKPQGHLQLCETADTGQSLRAFDVVGGDEGPPVLVRPSWPTRRTASCRLQDGPALGLRPYPPGMPASYRHAKPPGKERLQQKISAVTHGQTASRSIRRGLRSTAPTGGWSVPVRPWRAGGPD